MKDSVLTFICQWRSDCMINMHLWRVTVFMLSLMHILHLVLLFDIAFIKNQNTSSKLIFFEMMYDY